MTGLLFSKQLFACTFVVRIRRILCNITREYYMVMQTEIEHCKSLFTQCKSAIAPPGGGGYSNILGWGGAARLLIP